MERQAERLMGSLKRVDACRIETLSRHRSLVALAAALFVAVTVIRFALGDDPGSAVTLFYLVPIVLLGLEYGVLGGLVGAAIGIGLTVVWGISDAVALDALGYLTRAALMLGIGGWVGFLSELRARAEARSSRWFEMSGDMLCEANLDGYFTLINEAAIKTLGWSNEELTAKPFVEFVHPDDAESTIAVAGRLAAGPSDIIDFENRYSAKDGSWRWVLWSARSDETRIYAVGKDITERKALETEREQLLVTVQAMARTDVLTGLPNRRSWDEELSKELARSKRQDYSVAVALLDLDSFKRFNDEHGHQAGDEFLREAGADWRLALRETDLIARYGGEEFAVLMPRCPPQEASTVVDRVRGATPQGQTASAGIANWDGTESALALVARADAALYAAKSQGRNRTIAVAVPA